MIPKKQLFIVATLFALGVLTGIAALLFTPLPPLPVYGQAPDFVLTDSHGESFERASLQGRVWVADFFFSTCAGPCPKMAKNMHAIQTAFSERDDVHLVNISVDPAYDSPEQLRKYAIKVKANTERWHFLTGSEKEIYKVAIDGFKMGNPDKLIYHSQKFALIDRQGQVRGYYEGVDPEAVKELIEDLRTLL